MPNPPHTPPKQGAPTPERPDYVKGSRGEQTLFYVTMAVVAVLLAAVLFYTYAG